MMIMRYGEEGERESAGAWASGAQSGPTGFIAEIGLFQLQNQIKST